MQRYFSLSSNEIVLSNDDIYHILKVLRGKVGDTFEVVFNENVCLMKISNVSPFKMELIEKVNIDNELDKDVTLFYCLAKGEKNDLVIQKCTELGVKNIVFISSSRVIKRLSQDEFDKKAERFRRIAKEAAEQSKRNTIPNIYGLYDINDIPSEFLCDFNYVAYEEISSNTEKTMDFFHDFIKRGNSIGVLIGPEGGLNNKEVEALMSKGFNCISLGKRILRTETAAIYVLSVLSFLLESQNG